MNSLLHDQPFLPPLNLPTKRPLPAPDTLVACNRCGKEQPFSPANFATQGVRLRRVCKACAGKAAAANPLPPLYDGQRSHVCSVCGEDKPLNAANYYRRKSGKYNSQCLACQKKREREQDQRERARRAAEAGRVYRPRQNAETWGNQIKAVREAKATAEAEHAKWLRGQHRDLARLLGNDLWTAIQREIARLLVADGREISYSELCSLDRSKPLPELRAEIARAIYSKYELTTPQLALLLGRRDHTTALYWLGRRRGQQK